MAVKVGINGFGRIGRLVYRAGMNNPNLVFVAVNDITDAETLAHLLKYDSVHGKLDAEVIGDNNASNIWVTKSVGGEPDVIQVYSEKRDLRDLPWRKLGVEIVVESTGKVRDGVTAQGHRGAGAKMVLISAPAKESDIPVQTIVLGVNDDKFNPKEYNYFTIGSCTTNCLAPIAKVINDNFGIKYGFMTTIHAYTNDQRILDTPHKDLRRARAAAVSMIPTTTGAAKAISLVLPELEGKLDGVAVRVPVPNASLVDFVCVTEKDVTVESVNAAVKTASEEKMKGYIEYCEDPIVSCDVIGNPHSAVFDAPSTMVKGKNLLKVFAWYDNEWGFSCRMVEMLELMAQGL